MLQYGADLFRGDAGEPLHELVDARTVLKILEQRGDRHTSTTEHPGSTDPFGVPFDGGASRPVDHETNGSIATDYRLKLQFNGVHGAESTASTGPSFPGASVLREPRS